MIRFFIPAFIAIFGFPRIIFADGIANPSATDNVAPARLAQPLVQLSQCRSDLESFPEGKDFLDKLSDWEHRYFSLQIDAKETSCKGQAFFDKARKWQFDGDVIQTSISVVASAKRFTSTDKRNFSKACKAQAKEAERVVVKLKVDADGFCK